MESPTTLGRLKHLLQELERDDTALRERVAQLESENKALRKSVEVLRERRRKDRAAVEAWRTRVSELSTLARPPATHKRVSPAQASEADSGHQDSGHPDPEALERPSKKARQSEAQSLQSISNRTDSQTQMKLEPGFVTEQQREPEPEPQPEPQPELQPEPRSEPAREANDKSERSEIVPSSDATTAIASDPPSSPPAIDTNRQWHPSDFIVNPNYSHAYTEVVRGKQRQCIQGHDCADCAKFYSLLGTKAIQKTSRHRQEWKRQDTPTGFWRSDFADTQEHLQEKHELAAQRDGEARTRLSEALVNGRYLFRDKQLRELAAHKLASR